MGGYFEWKLIWTWLPEHKSKIGNVAKEYLVGVYDAPERTLKLRGIRQNDPADIISMDTYIIQVSPDGKSIDGINIKPENYHGSLFGVLLPPKPPLTQTKEQPTLAHKTDVQKSTPLAKPAVAANNAPKKAAPNPAPVEAPAPTLTVHKVPDQELSSREIVTKQELRSADTQVKIRIYDESMIDGDVVSLNWNGEWVLRYYRIAKVPKEIILDLQKGENTLIMHAENLGRYPPNTAAISVQRDGKTEVLILNSDMGKSEAIKILRN